MHSRTNAVTLIATAFFLVVAGFTGGCSRETRETLFSAVGSYGDVAVFESGKRISSGVDSFLAELNPQERYVLKLEDTYRFHRYAGNDWTSGRNYRNLIFIVRWGDGGPIQKEVARILSAETLDRLVSGNGGLVTLQDPYFRNQLGFVFVSTDRRQLKKHLGDQASTVARVLREDINRRMIHDNRRRGLHPGLAQKYYRDYGFSMEIPRKYKENQVQPDGFPGLELMMAEPVTRGLSVSWEASEDPIASLRDRDFLLGMRERMGRALHSERLEPSTLEWSEVEVAGLDAIRLAGAWASEKVGVGGPFRCYYFADPGNGRVFCVDLLVYAPHKEKMDDFRRLHAILETFSLEKPDDGATDR